MAKALFFATYETAPNQRDLTSPTSFDACGGGDAAVAELAVGVDALVDSRPGAQTFKHNPDVSVSHPVTLERAEYPGGGR